eukprot:scaffold22396_cov56-Phaeocystis_antarctica.AAC.6
MRGAPPQQLHLLHRLPQAAVDAGTAPATPAAHTAAPATTQPAVTRNHASEASDADEGGLGKVGGGGGELGVGELERGVSEGDDGWRWRWQKRCNRCGGWRVCDWSGG